MNPANLVTVYMRRAVEHKDDYEVQHWVSVNAVLAVCPDQSLATMTRIDEVMHDHLARHGRAWLANRDLAALVPGQFAEVLFRADVPDRYLPDGASQTERAIAAIQYLGKRRQEMLVVALREVVPELMDGFGADG